MLGLLATGYVVSGWLGVRRDQSNTGKVAPVAAWIACQQRQLRHSCMGADKKIGQHSDPAATVSAIALKHFAGEKRRGAWNLYELKPSAGKHTINVLGTRVADRELRIHDGVDHNGAAHCGGIELT